MFRLCTDSLSVLLQTANNTGFREAAALQIKYTDLIDALFLEVNPIPIKTALNLAGYEVGSLRLPLCAMSDGHLETLRRAMESAHLLQ